VSSSETRQRRALVGVRLEPDEHRRALELAQSKGITLPELLRQALAVIDGDVREEWMVEIDKGDGWAPSLRPPFITTKGPAPHPVYAADIDAYMRGIVKPKRKMRRTVHTGLWRPVLAAADGRQT
jgi:hypothetical protein